MRDSSAARPLRLVLLGTIGAIVLAACGGGSGGAGSATGNGNGNGGGGGDGGGSPELPTDTTSSKTAYVVPTTSGWQVVPLLTVGDTVGTSSYAMVGKPDGLGVLAGKISASGEITDTSQYLTVLMNHELPQDRGVVRAHGTKGAFVSQWTLDLNTLKVLEGRDLTTRIFTFANGTWSDATGSTAFDRLCSANLPAMGALFNSATGNGFNGRIYTNGEEADTEGRAFAHVLTGSEYGTSYQLAYLGRLAHETVLLNPASGDTTLAVTLDDASSGQVYVYVGTKSNSGNAVERAGLQGGKLYGVKVTNGGAVDGTFQLVDVSDAALGTGTELQATSVNRGITEFARPEGGFWDTKDDHSLYFAVTGASVDGHLQSSRLYKLTFDSIAQPTGGTITLAVDSDTLTGTDGLTARNFDNVTVDGSGKVVIDEDAGDSDYVSKVWLFDPATNQATQILESDRSRFATGGANFLTVVEENSGVNEITDAVRNATWFDSGRRYYIGDNQAHYPLDAELFEDGQLYLFATPK
jgi:Bacterial protein of unknown function (DUF839).